MYQSSDLRAALLVEGLIHKQLPLIHDMGQPAVSLLLLLMLVVYVPVLHSISVSGGK